MLDPELPDGLARMRQRETVGGFRMRKAGRIEVQADAVLPGPGDPVPEMARRDFITVHFFAVEFTVGRVQVQAVSARNEGKDLLHVGPEFFRCAGFAGITAGGDQAAAQGRAGIFKPADVITLPAMEGNRDACQRLQRRVNLHADGGITVPGQAKGFPGPISQVHDLLVKRALGFAQGYSEDAPARPSGWRPAGCGNAGRPAFQDSGRNCLLRIDIRVFNGSLFYFPHK